jgi:phage tail sheath gpL-like
MGKSGSHGTLTSYGSGKNSKHISVMGAVGPTPPWEYAAAYAGQVAKSAQADPARPVQRLPMFGVMAPKATDEFTLAERNLLLYDGISTFTVVSGVVYIERAITTYQKNAANADDISYLDIETLNTLSYLRYSFRNRMLLRYPRHKLANNGTRAGAGQPIVTPDDARAEAVLLFDEWQTLGLVEAPEQFARDIVVERNISDPNRLDFLLPPDLINQFRVAGSVIQFLL